MAFVTKPNSFQNGYVADAAAVNANFDTIYNDYNGNITDTNIAITGITTYGKVSGSAIATLGNLNSGAGTIPAVNLGTIADSSLATISTAGKVSGAALTSLASIPAGAGVVPAANLPAAGIPITSVADYGTSASSSTPVTSGLRICYGSFDMPQSASQAITNLPFTSAASYSVCVNHAEQNVSASDNITQIVRNSGAQFTIYNGSGDSGTLTVNWIAIGT